MSGMHAGKISFPSLMGAGMLTMLLAGGVNAAGISLFGNWSTQIGLNNLTGGIGTDYTSPIESDSTLATVTIDDTADGAWTVWVRQVDVLPSGVTLAVRRSGDGSGSGGISGGASYVHLNGMEQQFFSGVKDRNGITLQLALFGVSIGHPPGFNGCSVVYRVSQP